MSEDARQPADVSAEQNAVRTPSEIPGLRDGVAQETDADDAPPPPQAVLNSAVEGPFGDSIIAALKTVYDPEIPVDIYELGLIYLVDISETKDIVIDMTLTAPGCPIAGEMPIMVESAVKSVDGVGDVTVNMTFDPPWTPERMSEEARLSLNMF